jgi:hypothetical protein
LDVLSDTHIFAKNLVNQLAALLDKIMKQGEEHPDNDPGDEFEGQDSGRIMNWRQMVYFGWKEGANIEPIDNKPFENGVMVEDELFLPVE